MASDSAGEQSTRSRLREARVSRGWSQGRVLYELEQAAKARGMPIAVRSSLKTQLSRWENGHRAPDPLYQQLLCTIYGRNKDDLGFVSRGREDGNPEAGLVFADTWTGGIDSATELWQEDMERREFLRKSTFAITAFGSPVLRWLVAESDEAPQRSDGSRNLGQAHVDSIREMTRTFRGLDNHYGGGHVRHQVVRYLRDEVAPMLRQGTFSSATGRGLFAASAELTQLAGWMSYDTGQYGLSQRYLIQALRLAKSAGDRALGAEILAAMSHQATYLGQGADAVDLARASGRTASQVGVQALVAEAAVMEAHGEAKRGEERACTKALSSAERALDQADRAADPQWISYFDEAYLSAKFGHCFHELGQSKQAQRFAHRSLDMDNRYVRGRAFNLSLLASSLARQGEVEHACAAGRETVDLNHGLFSARATSYLSGVLDDLEPYADHADVQALKAEAQPLLASAA
jgi:transcriptional regulator with XRE-family HTH domain